MKLTRRTFIKTGLIASPLVIAAAFTISTDYPGLIVKTILKRLDYLKLKHDDVVRFAADYESQFHKSRSKVIAIDLALTAQSIFPGIDKLNRRIDEFENYIVVKFLESSDFFLYGADEQRTVNYLGLDFSSPYKSLCANPFAKFDPEA